MRQGNPLSPILFNFVADCLSRMFRKAQRNNLICGLADNLIEKGVVALQYADDTIVCLKDDLEVARNMKLLLYLYEMMSGLRINFAKSEVILINGDEGKCLQYAELFNCQIGYFSIMYLGVVIGYFPIMYLGVVSPCRLHVRDWLPLVEKNEKKLEIWKGISLSIAGRTTLINSSLSSIFIYYMSMYLLPKTIVDTLDKQRRKFFWQGGGRKRNII